MSHPINASRNQEPTPPSLEELQSMAMAEAWDAVDEVIRAAADDEKYVAWATTGIENDDANLRDLAVSLLEKSPAELSRETRSALQTHMDTDDNPYVRFRAAFALYGHGDRSPKVRRVIESALDDEDVAEIARGYLGLH